MFDNTLALDEALLFLNEENTDMLSLIETQIMELQNESRLFTSDIVSESAGDTIKSIMVKFVAWVDEMITKLKNLVKTLMVKVRTHIAKTMTTPSRKEIDPNVEIKYTDIDLTEAADIYNAVNHDCTDLYDKFNDSSVLLNDDTDKMIKEYKDKLEDAKRKYKALKEKDITIKGNDFNRYISDQKSKINRILDQINDASKNSTKLYSDIIKFAKDQYKNKFEDENGSKLDNTDSRLVASSIKLNGSQFINLNMNYYMFLSKLIMDRAFYIAKIQRLAEAQTKKNKEEK